jgi:hypothetical protein
MKSFKPHHRLGDLFDESVILFNQVVQILDLANFYKTIRLMSRIF